MRWLGGVVSVLAVLVACSDRYAESPSTTSGSDAGAVAPRPGDLRGECINGRCLEGLTCISNVCVEVAKDAGDSADTSISGDADVSPPIGTCGEPPTNDPQKMNCPTAPSGVCDVGKSCCLANTVAGCSDLGCNKQLRCTAPKHCMGAQTCCAKGLKLGNMPCAGEEITETECCVPSDNTVRTCDAESGCPEGTQCVRTTFELFGNEKLVLGLCR